MKLIDSSYFPGLSLLIASFCISLLCFKDFGITVDEVSERFVGLVSYNYVFNGDNTLNNGKPEDNYLRDHGPGFEIPLIFAEKIFKLTDTRDIYLSRHLITNLFFLFSVFCAYLLILNLFNNQFIACLGFLLLAYNPRLYAHSYFNAKDLPFLSSFLISLVVYHFAFQKNKTGWYILLGLVCAYTTSIRIMGILLFALISLCIIIDLFFANKNVRKKYSTALNFLLFTVSFMLMLYVSWPALWRAPLHNFIAAYNSLAQYQWKSPVLFSGKTILSTELPWYYLPLWISISTPLLWLLSGLTGIAWILVLFVKDPLNFLKNTINRNYLLYIACFLIPILSVIFMHSVVYDDWRHVYFIYPPFAMLALFALHKLMSGKIKKWAQCACILQIVFIAYFMLTSHPFEQVYFNRIVSHSKEYLRKNFELDYWGASYKDGIHYILAHDTSSVIRIQNDQHVIDNYLLLSISERKRFMLVDINDSPRYFLTNYRWHADDLPYPARIADFKVLNSTIMSIYKMK